MQLYFVEQLDKGYEVTTPDNIKFKKYDRSTYTMEKDKHLTLISQTELHDIFLATQNIMGSKITYLGEDVPSYDNYWDKLDDGKVIVMSHQGHIMTFEKTPSYIFTEEYTRDPKSKETTLLDKDGIEKLFKKYQRSIHTVRLCD
ncbi:MAG: hypothetical protein Terrestrivirus3_172 [Terrestrivirus sp.]|uniref:Uncharacterized protein n=1 Tax=Terrestrivirus sp. TaxID=2487775 RepID=A0A3G4ZQL3_9VIRU|nr:MAG: hypothetical protein Terrestrivirus3_172 [Terrestrivirus sp.]